MLLHGGSADMRSWPQKRCGKATVSCSEHDLDSPALSHSPSFLRQVYQSSIVGSSLSAVASPTWAILVPGNLYILLLKQKKKAVSVGFLMVLGHV